MLKKIITYKDFDGKTQTEEFYFHLSAPELVDIEVDYPEGYGQHIENALKNDDKKAIVEAIKLLMRRSFGRRSADGKRFQKDPEFWTEFTETNAYEKFFLGLFANNGKEAEEFFNSLMTKDLIDKAKALKTVEDTGELPEKVEKNIRDLTQDDINAMSEDEIATLMVKNKGNVPTKVLLWVGQRK